MTSGFYVHNISAQLTNAHEILVAMGYVHVDETTLNVMPKLDEKRIKNVSKDMIVASQECLVGYDLMKRNLLLKCYYFLDFEPNLATGRRPRARLSFKYRGSI